MAVTGPLARRQPLQPVDLADRAFSPEACHNPGEVLDLRLKLCLAPLPITTSSAVFSRSACCWRGLLHAAQIRRIGVLLAEGCVPLQASWLWFQNTHDKLPAPDLSAAAVDLMAASHGFSVAAPEFRPAARNPVWLNIATPLNRRARSRDFGIHLLEMDRVERY